MIEKTEPENSIEELAPAPASAALDWAALAALITTASRRLRNSLSEQIARHGLGESEFALLWVCFEPSSSRLENEGLTQTEIAHALDLSPASVSGLVEQLRSVGLLAGSRSTIDRRRQVWHLTERGRTFVEQLLYELQSWGNSLDRAMGAMARETIHDLLGQLIEAAIPAIAADHETPPAHEQRRRGAAA